MDSGRAADDDVLVLPPLPADPLFVDAVDEAVAGSVDDLPDAQPQRILAGNTRDFASLYIRHRASFGLHARRFLYDPRDVEEVLQEAFLRLFLAMPELETELQALSYCRRTVTNLCIDRYRADQRRPRLVDLDAIEWDPSDELLYDDPVLRAEDAAIVRQALALLSPMHRAALVKREIEEKPLPQIAEELGVPEESVKHVLYRARRALRRLLVGTSVEPGADLSNTQLLRLANERLARATLRSANVLIVLFVAAVTVVGALRVGANDQARRGVDVGSTPQVGATAPAAPAHPSATPHRHPSAKPSGRHHVAHTATVAPKPAAPAPPVTVAHKEGFTARKPARHQRSAHAPSLVGPRPGTFTINAPVLGATGSAAISSSSARRTAGGGYASMSTFAASTAAGQFGLEQDVQVSGDGVISANLTPSVPVTQPPSDSSQSSATTTTYLHSSAVTTQPTDDGNVLVDVKLVVIPGANPVAASQGQQGTPLSIDVQALYTSNVVLVLAESVTVTEGPASCCVTSSNPSLPSPTTINGTSTLPSAPTAVGSAAVSLLSTNRRDDQTGSASS